MTPSSKDRDDNTVGPDDIERVFAEHVAGLPEGATPNADALAAARPEHAAALRLLCEQWCVLWAAQDDAGPSVQVTGDGVDDPTWRSFIEQLRSRGAAHTRYVLKGEIARGGMGVIHRVYDQDVQRPLAMKVILGRGDSAPTGDTPQVDDRTLGRFLEEAQVTGQLDHPGIVPVHEMGVDPDGQVYFTMKLVKGEDLRVVFDRVADTSDDTWTVTRALGVLLRVCEAMAYAHDKGVIHRDLKPGNVMVGKFGEVYVMDWGLARVLGQADRKDLRIRPEDSSQTVLRSERRDVGGDTPADALLTMDGDIVGTPAYMPPEQAEGRIDLMGPPADVYAMGAMLYHLLAGHMPYAPKGSRKSIRMILAEVTRFAPPPLAEEAKDAPPELLAICEKAMARKIEDRYPDMTALARDLRAFLEERVVSAYETGAIAELKSWVRRNRALAGTAAAALLAVLVLSGWAVVERGKARGNAQLATTRAEDAEREKARADENAKIATTRAEDAEREKVRADTNARTATARADDLLRLSDARRLAALKAETNDLWPTYPDKIDGFDAWLLDARSLLANLPAHEAKLRELRANGTPLPLGPVSPALEAKDAELSALREHLATHEGDEPGDGIDDPVARADHVEVEEAAIVALEAELPALRKSDDVRRERERSYDFGSNVDAGWWHDAVRDLVVEVDAFQTDDRFGETIASVEWRRAEASTIAARTTTGPDAAAAWAAAIAAIREHPAYGGLSITPQLGVVPLGADPDPSTQHLWEFWHVQSGTRPERDEANGRWRITGETGLVFVLIPGGTCTLGAQKDDKDGPNYDQQADSDEAVYEVELAPYLLSKYELTQGQWKRMTDRRPSDFGPEIRFGGVAISLSHPVEQVSWGDCQDWLPRYGLSLPTESQWERGARGGTSTSWWTGRERRASWWTGRERTDLDEAANLADAYCRDNGGDSSWAYEDDLNDGFFVHAPVGALRANAFGLHDVIGNVQEWCMDHYVQYGAVPVRAGDGLRVFGAAVYRVHRGGSWVNRAVNARSAARAGTRPDVRNRSLGIRPARVLAAG